MAAGHENAFGFSVKDENFDALMEYSNTALAQYDFTPRYKIDYVFDGKNINTYDIIDIASHNDIWGEGLEQPLILIQNLSINQDMIEERGNGTLIIKIGDMECVKFKAPENDFKRLETTASTYKKIDIIGTCSINDYNSTPQIIIEDFEVVEQGFYF